MSLRGRRALITGGAGHIATAMAETLAELGANLILVDLDQTRLDAFSTRLAESYGLEVRAIRCDLEDEVDSSAMIAAIEAGGTGLDILINNAAFVGTSGLQGWAVPFEHVWMPPLVQVVFERLERVIGCGHVSGLSLRQSIQLRAGMAMRGSEADQQTELIGSSTNTA